MTEEDKTIPTKKGPFHQHNNAEVVNTCTICDEIIQEGESYYSVAINKEVIIPRELEIEVLDSQELFLACSKHTYRQVLQAINAPEEYADDPETGIDGIDT